MGNEDKHSRITETLSPWNNNENLIWLASTFSLHRNIEKFKFPIKMEVDRKRQVLSLTSNALLSSKSLSNPYLVKGEDITPLERDFILEHFLIFEGFQDIRQGEGFILDDTGMFVGMLNVKDHINIQCIESEGNLDKGFQHLLEIESSLSSSFNFAASSKFGHLTSDPTLCGTGLIISGYLHLPALIHKNLLQDTIDKEKSEAVLAYGLQGNPEDLIGDILVVRNIYTLGVNEESVLSIMRQSILKFVLAEKSLRSRIKTEDSTTLKDKVSRALGVLKYSFQLETVEALSAISLLKLGIELEWIQGFSVQQVNNLFFACRRAHLSATDEITKDEISAKRANFLREKMANVSLLIL